MDNEQLELMRTYGYEPIVTAEDVGAEGLETLARNWYEQSCELRFIKAVTTNTEDPDAGFETIIAQDY